MGRSRSRSRSGRSRSRGRHRPAAAAGHDKRWSPARSLSADRPVRGPPCLRKRDPAFSGLKATLERQKGDARYQPHQRDIRAQQEYDEREARIREAQEAREREEVKRRKRLAESRARLPALHDEGEEQERARSRAPVRDRPPQSSRAEPSPRSDSGDSPRPRRPAECEIDGDAALQEQDRRERDDQRAAQAWADRGGSREQEGREKGPEPTIRIPDITSATFTKADVMQLSDRRLRTLFQGAQIPRPRDENTRQAGELRNLLWVMCRAGVNPKVDSGRKLDAYTIRTPEDTFGIPLQKLLQRFSKFAVRWRFYNVREKHAILRDREGTLAWKLLRNAIDRGDFLDWESEALRNANRLREEPRELADFVREPGASWGRKSALGEPIWIHPHDPIVVLQYYGVADGAEGPEDRSKARIARVSDFATGWVWRNLLVRRRVFELTSPHYLQRAAKLGQDIDDPDADARARPVPFQKVRGVGLYNLPELMQQVLLARVREITVKRGWIQGRANHRDVYFEGRMVQHGARPGEEVRNDVTEISWATQLVVRYWLRYAQPTTGESDLAEAWSAGRIAVTWNRYLGTRGHGCPPHKNWQGLCNPLYIRFSEGDGSCAFSWYKKGVLNWGQSPAESFIEMQRLSQCIMMLGPAERHYLHSIQDVRGVTYSLVVRTVRKDLEEMKELSRQRAASVHSARARSRAPDGPYRGDWHVSEYDSAQHPLPGGCREPARRAGTPELPRGRSASRARPATRYRPPARRSPSPRAREPDGGHRWGTRSCSRGPSVRRFRGSPGSSPLRKRHRGERGRSPSLRPPGGLDGGGKQAVRQTTRFLRNLDTGSLTRAERGGGQAESPKRRADPFDDIIEEVTQQGATPAAAAGGQPAAAGAAEGAAPAAPEAGAGADGPEPCFSI
eukprot:TRINITY_DN20798_c0_g1_i1.p1 TRINITY_DN20798_c0_g1~~TRINITY_DN20798_c0_g1_i1.p1  ORF type:complete len:904 (+),score=161.97 TRINITY_DN20798_c0_g1_i1:83-2794(+)